MEVWLKPLKVLIVEDELVLALELQDIIEEAGHTVACHAAEGRRAKALAEKYSPDVALIDIRLRDSVSGIEVANHLARKTGTLTVFATASADELPQDLCGACGVIAKPYAEGAIPAALDFISKCLKRAVAPGPAPRGLRLAPAYAELWRVPRAAG
jgi:two-component system, response regulator PdtaR